MLKSAAAVLAAFSLGAAPGFGPAADPAAKGRHHPPRPPERFLNDGAVAVAAFADEATVHAVCLRGGPIAPGSTILACVLRQRDGTAVMILPNPCRYEGYYAELVCHEQGHANGWGAEHEA